MASLKTKRSGSSKMSLPPSSKRDRSMNERLIDIHVMVEGFENLHGAYQASDVFVQAEFLNIVIGESPQQPISVNDEFIPHNFHCILRFFPDVSQCIDDLISNPIVFNVFQVEGIYDTEHVIKKRVEEQRISPTTVSSVRGSRVGSKDKKKSEPKSKASSDAPRKSEKKQTQFHPELIGRCNIDLLPILLGEKEVKETLVLYPDVAPHVLDETIVSQNTLPRLRAYLRSPVTPIDNVEEYNVLEFSVESIYNVPTEIMHDNMRYTLATPLPINSELMESILIRDGVVRKDHVLDKSKIWSSLTGLESRASYSKYKFDPDISSIKNNLPIDLEYSINKSEKHIEWNTMRRVWLRENSKQIFIDKLRSYRKWPIEIYGTKSSAPKQIPLPSAVDTPLVTPSIKELPPNVERSDVHFMGFLDLTKLLYTGVSSTRVVCQLQTFNLEELRMETGQHGIFKDLFAGSVASKSKSTHRRRKSEKESADDNDYDSTSHIVDAGDLGSSIPLKISANEPTFIIIEVKLLHPFYPTKTIEELHHILTDFIPKSERKNHEVIRIEQAESDLQICIEDLIQVIYQEYNDFIVKRNTKLLSNLTGDEETDFIKFLNTNGANNCFKKVLKKKIYHVVSEKFPFKLSNENNITEWDNYINEIYVYLVKKINTVVNSFISPSIGLSTVSDSNINSTQLLLYAKEAEENDKLNLAERYYLELIENDKSNAESWLHYAIFQLNYDDIEQSLKLIGECLKIDSNYKYGLMFLGILLHRTQKYEKAEACFQSVTILYPDYLIGWVVFHLFYLLIDNYEGTDVTHEQMNKCLNTERTQLESMETVGSTETDTTDIEDDFEFKLELSWNVKLWENHQMYARAIVLLLKFKCFEFVKIGLAQELITSLNKISYSYYSTVCCYLSRQYNVALNEIQDALKIVGPDLDVGGLIGYCNFKLCNYQDAFECFESILYTFNCPSNILLIYTHLTHVCKYIKHNLNDALKYILLACKYTPTSNVWLFAGIIYYEMKDYQNAEICLKESNVLDNKLSDTWKYLSLINRHVGNDSVAEQCMQYANKYQVPSSSRTYSSTSSILSKSIGSN